MTARATRTARTTRSALLAASAATFALLLGACASGTDAGSGAGSGAGEAGTRTVESAFGETTIPADPQAALGVYTTDLDMLITLGIPLADSQPIRSQGYTTFPSFFDQKALEGIKTFENFPEYNYEEILAAEPDVILNGLGYDDELVTKLPDIAPTYSFNGFDGRDWRESFAEVAKAFDKVAEHDAWTARYQAKVDDVKARLAAAGIDPVVGPVGYGEGDVIVSCYGTPCLVFDDLGLKITPLAEGAEGTTLGTEQLEQLAGIDWVFTSTAPDEKTGELTDPFAELAGNGLWTSLPFVANGNIAVHDLEMIYGSPSGQYAFLEVVEKALLP
ncbi:ABC transporter substrate-binding protein [Oerskovia jenensis]|uniref:Iron complex transport system substrate-binding protein n=1 Tax=Oerskovia jenensis TaxID=162169 RepID=A0ABS2LEZ9_9CELL|nr:ABC transporter substrate-binding protein [Oerskovia jenensis]MBM7478988.1 iron complex transport system substrate-binding protein [Oerskovia jenensis]